MTDRCHNPKPDNYGYPEREPRLPRQPFPIPQPGDIPCYLDTALRPFLMIRGSGSDDGTRPIATLGGGSPDITIDGPETTLFSLTGNAHLVPAPGSEQVISARVWNLGLESAISARIRFWEVRTLQGTPPEPALIGAVFRGVPARSSVLVTCPAIWQPTNPSRVSIMVDVSDPIGDPISAPFDALADRHVAQKVIVSP